MKTIFSYLRLTIVTMVLFGALYPLAMVGIGKLVAPAAAEGFPVYRDDQLVGFANVSQAFTRPEYFWGRPSAVDHDASSTGGSNFGNQSEDLLAAARERTDALLAAHPDLTVEQIPVELITASGSGLDPHVTSRAVLIQANRVAQARGLDRGDLETLIAEHTSAPFLGLFGPGDIVNVLELNLALDALSASIN